MELRLLRYFVAVAELEHVGRAAVRLHVSQSPLSRQIRQLEASLGVALFVREHRAMKLTQVGRWLLGEARQLLARSEALSADARRIAEGKLGRIRVGFVSAAMTSGVLPAAIRLVRDRHTGVAIELVQLPSAEQHDRLARGELDLGVTQTSAKPPLLSQLVLEEDFGLAVAGDHRLARRRAIVAADIAHEPWIALASDRGRDRLLAACSAVGFVPDIVAEVSDRASMLALVGAGVGIGLVPGTRGSGEVVVRRLRWLRVTHRLWSVQRDAGVIVDALARALKTCG